MKAINLQKIVTVKGSSGLFHLINYNPKGYFLQPFEGGPVRFFSNEKGRILALGNVDLKLKNNESINLLEVFRKMEKHHIPNHSASLEALSEYFQKVIPDLDDSVAPTHLKKVNKWCNEILAELRP